MSGHLKTEIIALLKKVSSHGLDPGLGLKTKLLRPWSGLET